MPLPLRQRFCVLSSGFKAHLVACALIKLAHGACAGAFFYQIALYQDQKARIPHEFVSGHVGHVYSRVSVSMLVLLFLWEPFIMIIVNTAN